MKKQTIDFGKIDFNNTGKKINEECHRVSSRALGLAHWAQPLEPLAFM